VWVAGLGQVMGRGCFEGMSNWKACFGEGIGGLELVFGYLPCSPDYCCDVSKFGVVVHPGPTCQDFEVECADAGSRNT